MVADYISVAAQPRRIGYSAKPARAVALSSFAKPLMKSPVTEGQPALHGRKCLRLNRDFQPKCPFHCALKALILMKSCYKVWAHALARSAWPSTIWPLSDFIIFCQTLLFFVRLYYF
ncbi:hypothetical protein ABT364_19530 [Massilia sp. SR12]